MELGSDGIWRDWTGRDCPKCRGIGLLSNDYDGYDVTCTACAGTGEEYGPVSPPKEQADPA